MTIPAVSFAEAKRSTAEAAYGTPIVDGEIDEVWKKANYYVVDNYYAGGREEYKGWFKVLWDDEKMYVLSRVYDMDLCNTDVPHYNDSVDVYIDEDRGHQTGFLEDDYQIRSDYEGNISGNNYSVPIEAKTKVMEDGFYAEMADYVQAKKYLIETDASNLYSRSAVYSISAKLYHNIGNLDSATYYYKKLLVEGTLYAKRIANKGLAQIAAHKGKPNEALIYYQSYELITDSIYAMQDAENIRQLAVVYDYQLREKENQRLKQRNYTQQITFLIIIIIAIVICSSMWLYSQYHRRKQMELNFQMERLSKIQKEQDLYNKKLIEENNIKISNIEKQLQTSNKENRNLIIQLEGQKEIIRKTNRLAQIEIERREHAKDLIVYTPIYQHIESLLQGKERIKKLMTEDDWNVLEDTINELYVGFIPRIRYLQEMSEFEFRICLLIKIGIKVSDMARLTNHSNESVSSVRRRLYEKIHKRKGTPKELDNFIISL